MSSTLQTTHERTSERDTGCPECDGQLRTHATETVCSQCGLVTAEHAIDHGPEWRFIDAGTRERVGAPHDKTRHDDGLGSRIGYDRTNGMHPRRMAINERVRLGSKSDRGRKYAFTELRRMRSSLGLPEVCLETACRIFKQAQDAGLMPGRTLDGMAAAALVCAARIHGEPVTFDGVEAVMREHPDESGRLYRWYQRLVEALGVPVPPPEPRALLGGVCEAVGVGERIRSKADAILRECGSELVGSGRKPQGVVAAAVYLAAGGLRNTHCSQDEVADAAGCAAVTVRVVAREMDESGGRNHGE